MPDINDPLNVLGAAAGVRAHPTPGAFRIVGALSLVDPIGVELAEALIGEFEPQLSPAEVRQWLAALSCAGWIARDQDVDGPASASPQWHWTGAARQTVRSAFIAGCPQLRCRLDAVAADWFAARAEPARALKHAVSGQSWSRVVAIVESSWPALLFEHPGRLRRALRAAPVLALAGSPLLMALRELLLERPDGVSMRLPPLVSAADQRAIGRSGRARPAIELNLAAMVVLRRRGSLREARAYSRQLNAIRVASLAHQSPETSGLISLALEQSANLSELVGDSSAANAQLRQAYLFASASQFSFSADIAAARLALSCALRGQPSEAQAWLARVGERGLPRTPAGRTIRGIAQLATAMIAHAQLDRPRMSQALDELGSALDADEHWPFVLNARANLVLGWGSADQVAEQLAVVRDRQQLHEDGGVTGPLLAAVEASLLILLGRGNEARDVVEGRHHAHPILDRPRVRLALLIGDDARAHELALTALNRRGPLSPMQRLDETVFLAVAAHRLGRRPAAADALRRAVHQARVLDILLPFARVPRADLLAIAEHVPEARELVRDERLAGATANSSSSLRLVTLSGREQVILGQLSRGVVAAQIAQTLGVSINTIRSQRRGLYHKLGAATRYEALVIARELGLVAS